MKIENGKAVFENDEEKAAFDALLGGEVKGLKDKNTELLGKLKDFDRFKDIDPEEYAKLKKQATDAEEERQKKAGEFEEIRKKDRDAWEKEKASLRSSLEKEVLENQAMRTIVEAKGKTALLMPIVKNLAKIDESGELKITDENGNVRDGVTLKDLIGELKANDDYKGAFDPVGMSGAGTQQSSGGGGQQKTMTRSAWDNASHAERSAFSKDGGKVVDD